MNGSAAALHRAGVPAAARGRALALVLAAAALAALAAGLAAGSDGWSWRALPALWDRSSELHLVVAQIRAPRTLGAFGVGALLGLAGAIAQGLFRNPLADPYLLGSAAGASLAVVLVLAAGSTAGGVLAGWAAQALAPGTSWAGGALVLAAFAGALGGMALTLLLARGAGQTLRLLLAGVVVGVMLTAVNDLVTTLVPQALRGRQSFILGHTGFIGWGGAAWLALALAVALPAALRLARVLDALTLGEDGAASLGLALPRWRGALVAVLALATGVAVSQAGLVAFVGLVAPHLVRRALPMTHAGLLAASAAAGGTLLLAADVLARTLVAPQELPVGLLTAVMGGGYLLVLLHRKGAQGR